MNYYRDDTKVKHNWIAKNSPLQMDYAPVTGGALRANYCPARVTAFAKEPSVLPYE